MPMASKKVFDVHKTRLHVLAQEPFLRLHWSEGRSLLENGVTEGVKDTANPTAVITNQREYCCFNVIHH